MKGNRVLLVLHLDARRIARSGNVQRPDVQDHDARDHEGQQIVEREESVERGVVGRVPAEQPHADRLADNRNRREEAGDDLRSEEHTSELQSLMRISYAVLRLKKQTPQTHRITK